MSSCHGLIITGLALAAASTTAPGAAAVQVATACMRCSESTTTAVNRAALRSAAARHIPAGELRRELAAARP